ncbi:hypothetical protein PZN02_002740 [Sinorhizobium garamanticum]|uniref:Uncharacterized protein n=1 Tax=Sinorhizobium garamanticum TaxID=680247 RepID=A0ABY8DBN1_9HYPH|nr:hypothetical protein [Sinorhizobium garamanticum]WEX86456.1 hypothetical protein PZN02_002740 [Sinorhizobium garamanticum]
MPDSHAEPPRAYGEFSLVLDGGYAKAAEMMDAKELAAASSR